METSVVVPYNNLDNGPKLNATPKQVTRNANKTANEMATTRYRISRLNRELNPMETNADRKNTASMMKAKKASAPDVESITF